MRRPFGLVLAGGRSARFGAEKAVAAFRGQPLIGTSLGCLRAGCRALAVNAPAGSGAAAFAADHGVRLVADRPGDPRGPLAGVAAGLAWAWANGEERLVTVPCDTPFLPADLVERLCDGTEGPIAAARTSSGLHPLCALWHVSVLEDLDRRLLSGAHGPVQEFLASKGVRWVLFEDDRAFLNINTGAELDGVGEAARVLPQDAQVTSSRR